ncbi:MAG: flagellar protein FliS [Gemmatimonadota bacterium]|nr:flagellar protein FliS [Gemmatimonadota bacterium]
MGYPSAVKSYRENEVYSASPAQLFLMTFDYLIAQMTRARIGIETKQKDITLAALDRSRVALGELIASIDSKDNSDLARTLRGLFTFSFMELCDVGFAADKVKLERHLANIRELRDAFAKAAEQKQAEVA